MGRSCPGWSSEEIFSGLLSYTGFLSLWLVPMGSRRHRLLKISWKKLTRNATSRSNCKNTRYKMFKELVASQLITELKIREEQNEAESALKRLMDALKETSSEELKLAGSNPCDNAYSRNTDQEQRETNQQTFDLDMAEITPSALGENSCTNNVIHTGSEIRLNDKHVSLLQEVLQWPNTPKRTFKRITDGM
jgi:hypothetical protein